MMSYCECLIRVGMLILSVSTFYCRVLQSNATATCQLWRDWRELACHLCRVVRVWRAHPWEMVRTPPPPRAVQETARQEEEHLLGSGLRRPF